MVLVMCLICKAVLRLEIRFKTKNFQMAEFKRLCGRINHSGRISDSARSTVLPLFHTRSTNARRGTSKNKGKYLAGDLVIYAQTYTYPKWAITLGNFTHFFPILDIFIATVLELITEASEIHHSNYHQICSKVS